MEGIITIRLLRRDLPPSGRSSIWAQRRERLDPPSRDRGPRSASPPGYKQSYVASPYDLVVSSCWRAILDPEVTHRLPAVAGASAGRDSNPRSSGYETGGSTGSRPVVNACGSHGRSCQRVAISFEARLDPNWTPQSLSHVRD